MKNFPNRAQGKKILRCLFFTATVLVTLAVLVASWLGFQGRREWNQTKTELLARGEKLSVTELAPPPIADQLNFFSDPLWAEVVTQHVAQPDGTFRNVPAVPPDKQQFALFKQRPTAEEAATLREKYPAFAKLSYTDTRITIGLRARSLVAHEADTDSAAQFSAFTFALLAPLSPLLGHIEELSHRPGARFPLHYEEGLSLYIPHVTGLLSSAQAFLLRATANIRVHNGPDAFSDSLTLIRLSRVNANEPFLICHLVRISIVSMALSIIDEGIKAHVWTDAQLIDFERILPRDDLPMGLALSLRGERGGFNQVMESLRRNDIPAYQLISNALNPEGSEKKIELTWWQKTLWQIGAFHYMAIFAAGDQAFHNHTLQQCIDQLDAVQTSGLSSSIGRLLERPSDSSRYRHLLSSLTLPALRDSFRRTANIQDNVILTLLACALERYRLKNGAYPATLAELVPVYLPALPLDIVTLQPMHYERTAADQFNLWSIGWDNKDDHGRPDSRHGDDGDWPWAETLTSLSRKTIPSSPKS